MKLDTKGIVKRLKKEAVDSMTVKNNTTGNGGIYPVMNHSHTFVSTHKTNEQGVLIWECICGEKTASM